MELDVTPLGLADIQAGFVTMDLLDSLRFKIIPARPPFVSLRGNAAGCFDKIINCAPAKLPGRNVALLRPFARASPLTASPPRPPRPKLSA